MTNSPLRMVYDESAGYDDDTGLLLRRGLSDHERRQAVTLYRLFNELWGLCLILGKPGAGKDLFGNYISHTLGRYNPGKKILRDEPPRELFGDYAGIFDEAAISGDLKRMKDAAKGLGIAQIGEAMDKVADEWAGGKGRVMLQHSILYLVEYWRYCYKREPHNPMNKTMGGIHKVKRHLDTLIFGSVQQLTDLDKFTCLPFVDWVVFCGKASYDPTTFEYRIYKAHYNRRKEILQPYGTPFPITVDAGKPRSFLGDGLITIKKPDYQPETEEEQIVLDVIKAGYNTYDGLVDVIESGDDMTEREILQTLKELRLKMKGYRPKFVLDYPCWFGTFNSKSAVQLSSPLKVKVGD